MYAYALTCYIYIYICTYIYRNTGMYTYTHICEPSAPSPRPHPAHRASCRCPRTGPRPRRQQRGAPAEQREESREPGRRHLGRMDSRWDSVKCCQVTYARLWTADGMLRYCKVLCWGFAEFWEFAWVSTVNTMYPVRHGKVQSNFAEHCTLPKVLLVHAFLFPVWI